MILHPTTKKQPLEIICKIRDARVHNISAVIIYILCGVTCIRGKHLYRCPNQPRKRNYSPLQHKLLRRQITPHEHQHPPQQHQATSKQRQDTPTTNQCTPRQRTPAQSDDR